VLIRNGALGGRSDSLAAATAEAHVGGEFCSAAVAGHREPEYHTLVRKHTRVSVCRLRRLRARLAERKLGLELTEAAKEAVAEAGWDPAYGARPLKRALQRLVENPLALKLLAGEFGEGDTVRVDARDGELVFEKRAPVATAAT